jgi:hypothetical protein
MARKDKLSKEVEEQIQSLASDIYIQIEEKITQLICTVTPREPAEKISIEQAPAYLALQTNYQTSQNELAEKSKILSKKNHQLEQSTSTLKKQLADEINKKEDSELKFQVELTQKNLNFTETIERLEHQNILLQSTLTQEQEKLSSEPQRLKIALAEQQTKFNQTIQHLEKSLSAQEDKSHQKQTQTNAQNKKSQSQIAPNKKELLEQQQEMLALNNRLTEQKNQVKELTTLVIHLEHNQAQYQQQKICFEQESEQKISLLSEQLKQSQIAEENHQKVVADQQVQLVGFDEKIKNKIKEQEDAKHTIRQLNNEQSQIKQQQVADKKENDVELKEQQQAQEVLQQQINQLEIKNQELTNNLTTEQADIKLYQKEVSSLKSQVTLAQEGQDNILNRFNATRKKQEKDNDQVRETIKYLRDENNDMITQNNRQKETFIEQTSELEHKLIEYRLKFEYAQKQITQNS